MTPKEEAELRRQVALLNSGMAAAVDLIQQLVALSHRQAPGYWEDQLRAARLLNQDVEQGRFPSEVAQTHRLARDILERALQRGPPARDP